MPHISVRVPEDLYEQLRKRGRRMGVDSVSDAVRILLLWAIENYDLNLNILLPIIASHVIKSHCMIEEGWMALVENGPKLLENIQAKADDQISNLLEECKNNDMGWRED